MLVLDVCARTCAEVSAAVLCRGRAPGYGWRCWAVRCPASAASEPPTVDGRPARGAVVRRVARGATPPNGPASPGQTLAAGTSGATARDEPTTPPPRSRPAPGAAAPTPGAPGRTGNSILAKMVQGPFCFRGDHRSAHAPASLFGARQRLRTRTSAVCCLVCVSLDLAAISRPDLPCCNAHLRGSPSHTRSLSRSAPDFPAHVALLPGRRRLSSPPRL